MLSPKSKMKIVYKIAAWLFILSVPLFLLTTTLRWGVGGMRLYQYGFNRYQVEQNTALEKKELLKIAQALIHYFNSGEEPFQVTVIKYSQEFQPFTDKEVTHLRDVKGLIRLAYRLQEGTGVYLALYCLLSLVWRKKHFWQDIAWAAMMGSGLTLLLMLLLGAGALFGFEPLFLGFHLVGFRNFLWVLDPSDYLLRMFPEGFFRDAALWGTLIITIEAVLLGIIATGLWLRLRRSPKGRANGLGTGGATGSSATPTRAT